MQLLPQQLPNLQGQHGFPSLWRESMMVIRPSGRQRGTFIVSVRLGCSKRISSNWLLGTRKQDSAKHLLKLEELAHPGASDRILSDIGRCCPKLMKIFFQEKDPNEKVSPTEGFVKPSIKFIITDKLEIMPTTTIVSMSILNKVGVVAVADLESVEITVSIT